MRRLGPGGPEISVIGFGSWEAGGSEWGPNDSDERVIEAMHAGFDAGMTWIDTAEVYGPHRSEELVGRAVRKRPGVLVFTKVAPDEGGSGFRPHQVKKAIRDSLARLGRDHVDLYQLHWPDHSGVPLEDTWGAMAELQDEGLTRHIGVSNFSRELIERCLTIRRVDSVQNELSLFVQDDRAGLLDWLAAREITYMAYSPMAAGLLTGALSADHRFADSDWRSGKLWEEEQNELFQPANFKRNLAKVERLRAVAEELGTSPAAVALRWVIEIAPNTVAIAGSRDPRHARSNAVAGDVRVGDRIGEIESLFIDEQ